MPIFKSKPKPEQPQPKPENGGMGMVGRAARQLGGRSRSVDEQVEKTITGARKTRTRSA